MQACARIGAIAFGGVRWLLGQERAGTNHRCRARRGDHRRRADARRQGDRAQGRGRRSVAMGGCEKVRNVIVYERTGSQGRVDGKARQMAGMTWWRKQPQHCEPTWVSARASAVHPVHVGLDRQAEGRAAFDRRLFAVGALTMKWVFDIKPTDIFWCTADVGWVTGHTYVCYGPLAVGATEVMFEGVPTYPDAGRFWKMIQDHKVYGLLHRADGDPLVDQGAAPSYRRNTTCRGCACSAPLASRSIPKPGCGTTPRSAASRCPIVDTWWQTETGGHMISPLPGATPLEAGLVHIAAAGNHGDVVDETGHEVANGQGRHCW